jgi:hypothetical protein
MNSHVLCGIKDSSRSLGMVGLWITFSEKARVFVGSQGFASWLLLRIQFLAIGDSTIIANRTEDSNLVQTASRSRGQWYSGINFIWAFFAYPGTPGLVPERGF